MLNSTAFAEQGVRVYGYDIFQPLIWFWRTLTGNPEALADEADSLRKPHPDYENGRGLLKEDFINIREDLKSATHYSLQNAAKFYALNRSSFSGATLSGGCQKKHLTQGLPTPLLRESESSKNQNYMSPRLILSNQSQHTQKHSFILIPHIFWAKTKRIFMEQAETLTKALTI